MTTQTAPAPSDQGAVTLTRDGAVARITFDRPQARNAMTWTMYEGMARACDEIMNDPGVRVAVFRGAGGKAFVAGTDIAQFAAFESGEDGIAYEDKVETYLSRVERLPMPTLCVVEGWAVGGGMAIANACDFRIATPGSRFGVPIARTLGNCLSARNLRGLTETLGVAMVKRMLMMAEMPTAEELTANAYVLRIAPPEQIDAVAEEIVQTLLSHAPVTMQVTKEALRRLGDDLDPDDQDLIRRAYGSRDFRHGVASFVAKQKPEWKGE